MWEICGGKKTDEDKFHTMKHNKNYYYCTVMIFPKCISIQNTKNEYKKASITVIS